MNSTANNIFRNIFGNIVTESHIARLATIVVASASCHADAQSSGSVIVWGPPCKQTCGSPEFGGPLTEFSVANTHVAAIGHGGLVVCWGGNSHGQCNVPADLGPVVSVAAAEQITVAVRADGTVRCWGYNNYGGCPNIPSPGAVGAVQVACGMYSGMLRLADGTVIGQGAPASASPSRFISAGDHHWLSIRTDGQLVAWGQNDSGQCNVPTNLGVCDYVTGGGSHTCAVTSTGAVRCWGYNNYGQCNVPANLPPAKKVGAGREHTIALLADGTVRGWGHNSWGQSNNPGATHVSHVDCAWYSSFALIGAPCPGDIFQNGQVDGADLGILLSQWGSAQSNPVGDLNGDLVVDGGDLAILLGSWGPCPE